MVVAVVGGCDQDAGDVTETSPEPARTSLGTKVRQSNVDRLAEWMAGWFSSERQARIDPEDYITIRLVMVPIWTNRDDGPWLYVEQASANALNQPYRQRVYHLVSLGSEVLRSDVYTLPGDPSAFVGAWRRDDAFADVTPDDLTPREGCSVTLLKTGPDEFSGTTVGHKCESSLRGAAYATSDVIVQPNRIISWDQGWNAEGEQVWGATKGGYIFEKISGEPPAQDSPQEDASPTNDNTDEPPPPGDGESS
jgi:hypothetical protein